MIHLQCWRLFKQQPRPPQRRQLCPATNHQDNNKHIPTMLSTVLIPLLLAHLGVGTAATSSLIERKLVRRLIPTPNLQSQPSPKLIPYHLNTFTKPPANRRSPFTRL